MALAIPSPIKPQAAGAPPAQVQAYQRWKKGLVLAQKNQWAGAAEAFAKANQWPADGAYGLAAIHALIKADQPELAVEMARQFRQIHPNILAAYTLESHALLALGLSAEAASMLGSVPDHVPRDHDFCVSLAVSLQRCGKHHDAIQIFMKALSFKLDNAATHFRLGMSFKEIGLKAEAAECLRTALALGADTSELMIRGLLVFLEREAVRWPQAQEAMSDLRLALARAPDGLAMESGAFPHAVFSNDPLEQLKVSRHYAGHAAGAVPALPKLPPKRRDGRIRLGYASADFHQHATALLMVQMLESHDRSQFEVFLFSSGQDDGSEMRRRVLASSEHFEDLRGFGFHRFAKRVRELEIDILVDLKGATQGTLLPVFSCRPARLQVAWLGFPGTTGAPYIDYLIGDRVVTPLEHAAHFSEQIAQMPHCYQPNDSMRLKPEVPVRSEWGVPQDALVLCGFHQPFKISPEVFDVWCRLLHAEPRAVLWLLQWNANVQQNLLAEAAARGIPASRLVFAPIASFRDHLRRLACADVFLDTWPCNAHTTASEALWVGVPVVTLIGQTFAQRVAASLLETVGLPELVASTEANYESKVLALMNDGPRRLELKKHLDAQRTQGTLFDGQRFARDIEALLLRMWDRKQKGLPPEALPAAVNTPA